MSRLTEKSIGTVKYDLKNFQHKPREFNDYDAFFAYSNAVNKLGEYEESNEPKSLENWEESYGDCLWWSFPIEEPPYVGSPLELDFPENVTHFTRISYPIGTN